MIEIHERQARGDSRHFSRLISPSTAGPKTWFYARKSTCDKNWLLWQKLTFWDFLAGLKLTIFCLPIFDFFEYVKCWHFWTLMNMSNVDILIFYHHPKLVLFYHPDMSEAAGRTKKNRTAIKKNTPPQQKNILEKIKNFSKLEQIAWQTLANMV